MKRVKRLIRQKQPKNNSLKLSRFVLSKKINAKIKKEARAKKISYSKLLNEILDNFFNETSKNNIFFNPFF